MRIPIPLLVHCSGPFEDDDTRFVLKQPGHYLPGESRHRGDFSYGVRLFAGDMPARKGLAPFGADLL